MARFDVAEKADAVARFGYLRNPMSPYWQLPLLFGTGLVAGFVDSVAGGGGLITVPVLMSCGLGPQEALGTNKLQATFGSASAAAHYAAGGAVALRDCVRCFLLTVIGAAAGAIAVLHVQPWFLARAIPVLLIAVAVYVFLKPDLGTTDLHPRLERTTFDLLFGLALGFYDGFFGPGTGTFWAMAYMLGLGFNMMRATAYTKVMNFGSNLSSLVVFLLGRKIYFLPGLVMGIGQLLGARIGSRMVLVRGTRFIRPIFLAAVLAITVKLLLDAYWR